MNRLTGIVAVAAILSLGVAAPAVAAPSGTNSTSSTSSTSSAKGSTGPKTATGPKKKAVVRAPSAPRSVTATAVGATSVDIGWKAPASTGSPALAGYSVTLVSVGGHAVGRTIRVGPTVRTARITGLTPGSRARLEVRARNASVSSVAAAVSFTPATAPVTPVDEGTAVFAVTNGRIVVFPTVDSAPLDVAAAPAAPGGYDVAANGDVTVLDSTAGTLVRYPATRAAPVTLATGLAGSDELHVSPKGVAYLLTASGALVEFGVDGTRRTVAESFPSAPLQLTVRANGDVVVLYTSVLRTYPAGGGAPVESTFSQGTTRLADLVAGAGRTNYFEANSGGAVGLQFWSTDDGSGTSGGSPSLTDRTIYAAGGYGLNGSFYSLQATTFCLPQGANRPPCTADLATKDVAVTSPSGVRTVVPATGLALQSQTRPGSIAADADGVLFVGLASGATPGLWSIAPAGGAAQLVEEGAFTDVQVID